ncbi:MAG: hypothetical protein ACHQET_10290 [Chitinophagales bacterium]
MQQNCGEQLQLKLHWRNAGTSAKRVAVVKKVTAGLETTKYFATTCRAHAGVNVRRTLWAAPLVAILLDKS